MIIRVFFARLHPGKRDDYLRLCYQKGLPAMRAQPGFLGYRVGAPRRGRLEDFVFATLWRDLDCLKSFTGEHWQAASILPGEADLLRDVAVKHYDESYASLVEMWQAVASVVKAREDAAVTSPLTDAQWATIAPLLRQSAPAHRGRGRPQASNRQALDGILYVLRSGHNWGSIPAEYASPATCWRRFSQWEADGTWAQVWQALLASLDAPGRQAWTLAFLDHRRVPTVRRRKPLQALWTSATA
jgi:transposase/quinol monooxygenase YgiN